MEKMLGHIFRTIGVEAADQRSLYFIYTFLCKNLCIREFYDDDFFHEFSCLNLVNRRGKCFASCQGNVRNLLLKIVIKIF